MPDRSRRLGEVTCAECSDTRRALVAARLEIRRLLDLLATKEAQLDRAVGEIHDYESHFFRAGYPTWEREGDAA